MRPAQKGRANILGGWQLLDIQEQVRDAESIATTFFVERDLQQTKASSSLDTLGLKMK